MYNHSSHYDYVGDFSIIGGSNIMVIQISRGDCVGDFSGIGYALIISS